ncbi:MAG: hypothetical protein ACP5RD_04010 [bacterium]
MSNKIFLYFILIFIGILIFIYLLVFSSCGPNSLVLAPIVGPGAGGGINNQLPLFSVGTYKMNTTNSSVKEEVSFGYFNYTTKPFAFVNINPTNNNLIPISFGNNSNFPNQGNKVLVLGTAFAGGDYNSGTDRDIFWVGKILDNNQSNWVQTITVLGNNYIVVKGTNFIARFNYNLNSFNSTFDTMTVKRVDNNNNYILSDFQNIDQDFKSIAFIKGGTSDSTGYYGILVGRNCAFSCINTDNNGNNFSNLYGLTNPPATNDYVWEDVIPFAKTYQNGLLIGHKISEGPGSAVFKGFDSSSGWGSDINDLSPFMDPFYTSDYVTLLSNNSIFKAAFIAGKNSLIGYINTPPNQNQFDPTKLEAIHLVNNGYGNVSFYGVTVLRIPGDTDTNYNVSGIAVGYDFSSNSPIILRFQRTGDKDNNPQPPFNSHYSLNRVNISNLNLGSDVVLLDVNNVLINGVTYVYVVGVDLSNCPIKPYQNGTLPPFTKSLVFSASAPFTTTDNDVINTLANMRGFLLYSNDGGNSFILLGNPFIK